MNKRSVTFMQLQRKKISRLGILWFSFLLMSLAVCGCGGNGQTQQQENKSVEEEAGTNEPAFSTESKALTVLFLDVGQGSSALVHQKDSWMLIDGGDREYSAYVVSFLKQQGVKRLDYVVVSHYDSDHLSGVVGVLNALECDQVLAPPDLGSDTKIFASFEKACEEKGIVPLNPKLGETFSFADSSFRVVSPAAYEYEDSNSNSLGIRLEYGDNSFLICGDCTEESEQDLLYQKVDLKSDVFAANHHGSRYSNSEEFLQAVAPEAVVVSCGIGNSYGHPDASVLLNIQKLGADLYRTDLQGVITAVSDGTQITFEQEPSMDYRSGTELREAGETGSAKEQTPETEAEGAENEEQKANGQGPELELYDDDVRSYGSGEQEYVLNTNTKKFHLPTCSGVQSIKEENRSSQTDRASILQQGYAPCQRCNP